MKTYRMYCRTIRNNVVHIQGKTLGCKELSHGELDGVRCAFKPYSDISDGSGFAHNGLTALWGTEKYYHSTLYNSIGAMSDIERSDRTLCPNGYYNWYWWHGVKE